ncbi:MAG: uncharacterized protein JWN14_1041 [Chthonomonadales bacterium]|nr:uncharacterized protein [Chthonomonadales bacterium]
MNNSSTVKNTAPRTPKVRALLSWSTGKDAAWSLHQLRQAGEVEVVALVTTTNRAFERVAMHAVRQTLLEKQAEAAGLPLVVVPLPWPCTNAQYEEAMQSALVEAIARFDTTHIAFGDLYLEEVRAYRERLLEPLGLLPLFPLWGLPTGVLAQEMIAGGLEAKITCIDPRRLHASFAGRSFDTTLLADLPPDVDQCGEGGEFHTCVVAGPMFAEPIPVVVGEVVERDGFVFADLRSVEPAAESSLPMTPPE